MVDAPVATGKPLRRTADRCRREIPVYIPSHDDDRRQSDLAMDRDHVGDARARDAPAADREPETYRRTEYRRRDRDGDCDVAVWKADRARLAHETVLRDGDLRVRRVTVGRKWTDRDNPTKDGDDRYDDTMPRWDVCDRRSPAAMPVRDSDWRHHDRRRHRKKHGSLDDDDDVMSLGSGSRTPLEIPRMHGSDRDSWELSTHLGK